MKIKLVASFCFQTKKEKVAASKKSNISVANLSSKF